VTVYNVKNNRGTCMPDVADIVGGNPAHIHPYRAFPQWMQDFLAPCFRIIYFLTHL